MEEAIKEVFAMRGNKIIITSLLLSGLLAGCQVYAPTSSNTTTEPKITVNDKFCTDECKTSDMSNYSIESKQFRDATYEDLESWLGDPTFNGIVYLGFEECPWCQAAVPVLNEVLKEHDIQAYYINRNNEVDGNSNYHINNVTDLLGKEYELDTDADGMPHVYYPTVLAIKNGKVVGHNVGTVPNHVAYERNMTEEEAQELYNLYDSFIKTLKGEG